MRLATSAIAKAHQWAKLESPCRDPGVRASLKGMGSAPLEAPAPVRRPHRSPSPASAAAVSKRPSKLKNEGSLTWPWWR